MNVRRLKQENYLLQTLFPAITEATSFQMALELTLQQVCSVTDWRLGEAWVPDPKAQVLRCGATWFDAKSWSSTNALPDGQLKAIQGFQKQSFQIKFQPNEGLPGRVWISKQMEWLENVNTVSPKIFRRGALVFSVGLKAAIGIPIVGQGEVLAVLVFFLATAKPQDYDLVKLMESIALQLGTVLKYKQTEVDLREAERRYRSIFENSIEGIFQTTLKGEYLDINPALARIYGYASPDDLMQSLSNINQGLYVKNDRRQEFMSLIREQGVVSQFESQIYRKDGEIIWISENAREVRDNLGNLLYYEGTVEDITQRKQTEESLRRSESKNRALLNVIPDVLFRVDRQGIYLDITHSCQNYYGFNVPPNEVIGRSIHDLLPTDVAQSLQAHILKTLDTGQPSSLEYQYYHERQIHDYEIRLVMSEVDEVLAIVRDITEQKRIERLKNEFVSMVSHELRTPLTSVKGSLGLIMGGVAGEISPQVKSLLEIAFNNSERLVLLINDILDIEKIESGKMDFHIKSVPLLSLVERAIESNLTYGAQYKVKFELKTSLKNSWVNVDSDRFMQVLTNLLSNAAKFSPSGSTVTISMKRPKFGWVRLEIQDQGPGIPDEFRSRIFQKFAQADSSDTRKKGGTGLGLSISKAIIEKLQGQIGFENPPEGGTIFYIELPDLTPELPKSEPQSISHEQSRILICEDDPDIAMLLKLILQQGGFSSDIAYNADQAKAYLERRSYSAITLDLALPEQDGISLIRELRSQKKTALLPIVVISAKAQQGQDALKGSGFKVIDWLEKPIDHDRLISALSQSIHSPILQRPKILHVENDPDILKVVGLILEKTADVVQAFTLQTAHEQLQCEQFDLVILDLDLPDGSGLELLPSLYTPTGIPIPVVVFSAQDTDMDSIHHVAASLVKSRTSNQSLLNTIRNLINPLKNLETL